jgi:hypothetical protein
MPSVPKKLICDRCGEILDVKGAIELALEGTEAWYAFVKGKGRAPRGLFPCKNWIRCEGEMVVYTGKEKKPGGNGHQG